MGTLKQKVALVTGASRQHGVGREIALRLAREGADVIVTSKTRSVSEFPDWEKRVGWRGIESVVEEITALRSRALALTADISNVDEVEQMVEAAIKKFGQIDILVNNAGLTSTILGEAPIIELDEQIWRKALDVNLTGSFLCSRAVARQMIKRDRGGKIVNIASSMAKVAWPNRGAYSASKFGLIALNQTLALELAPYKINVNAVCPGATMSDPGAGSTAKKKAIEWGISADEARERYYAGVAGNVPLGRIATPEDVANVVAFLASGESDFMTGQSINVSGGKIMH